MPKPMILNQELIGIKKLMWQWRYVLCLRWNERSRVVKATEIHNVARRLFEAHGASAIAEAAQKAVAYEQERDQEQAGMWRRVEAALKEMRGPRSS